MLTQAALFTLSIPSALASYGLLIKIVLSARVGASWSDRQEKTRAELLDGALDSLKSLRVTLDDFFSAYDAGEDPNLVRARPQDVLAPASTYVRLMTLQKKMDASLDRAVQLTKFIFYLAAAFAIVASVTVVLTALVGVIGAGWATASIALAGAVAIGAGIMFGCLLVHLRRVNSAEFAASSHSKNSPSSGEA